MLQNQILSGEDMLNDFIDRLVAEMRATNVEPEVLAQLKKDMRESLDQQINTAIMENLPKRKIKKFDKMLDKGADDKKFQAFLMKNIPNFDAIMNATLSDFRQQYISQR